MDERGCHNDTSTEIASEQVDVQGNLEPSDSTSNDREECTHCRDDQDDEESRHASSQTTIVLVSLSCEVADDLTWVGGVEVNAGRVESRHFVDCVWTISTGREMRSGYSRWESAEMILRHLLAMQRRWVDAVGERRLIRRGWLELARLRGKGKMMVQGGRDTTTLGAEKVGTTSTYSCV